MAALVHDLNFYNLFLVPDTVAVARNENSHPEHDAPWRAFFLSLSLL